MRLRLWLVPALVLLLGPDGLEALGRPPRSQRYDTVESMLSDYDILSQSSIQQHSLKKRDLQPETHVERLLSFSALQRHFKLYLTATAEHFSEKFQALIVDGEGKEKEYRVQWQDFFTGHVVGEHNSKVVAHIGDEDFTVRINTDGEEYNIEFSCPSCHRGRGGVREQHVA